MAGEQKSEKDELETLFWPGSLMGRGYTALLESAKAGGFEHMAINPLMIHQHLAYPKRNDRLRA